MTYFDILKNYFIYFNTLFYRILRHILYFFTNLFKYYFIIHFNSYYIIFFFLPMVKEER